MVSWVTNCTLAEISLNKFFSVVRVLVSPCSFFQELFLQLFWFKLILCVFKKYFGILFVAIGAVIIWRIKSSRYALAKKSILNLFAMMVRKNNNRKKLRLKLQATEGSWSTLVIPDVMNFLVQVIASGALCVLLDVRWFHFSAFLKVRLRPFLLQKTSFYLFECSDFLTMCALIRFHCMASWAWPSASPSPFRLSISSIGLWACAR